MRPLRHILTFTSALVIAVVAVNAPRRAAAFDYLANGGFESGDTGWIAQGADLDTIDTSEGPVADGAHSGRIVIRAGSDSFRIQQSISGGAGPGTYHLTVQARTEAPSTSVYVDIRDAGTSNTAHVESTGSAGNWTELSAEITATPDSALKIIIGGAGESGGIIYVDDVHFEGAPPVTPSPTSAASQSASTPPPTTTSDATATPEATATPAPEALVEQIGPELRNGDFESVADDGFPEQWHKYGGTLSSSTSPTHGGSRAAHLQSDTDSTKWLYQTVSVTSGGWYEFGAWILSDDGNVRSSSLRISWYASDDGSGSASTTTDSSDALTSPAGEYRYLTTGSIEAPGDAQSARLRILLAPSSAAVAEIFVDDATFGPATPAVEEIAPVAPTGDEAAAAPRLVLGESAAPESGTAASPGSRSFVGKSGVSLRITEVMYDPLGDDAGEWVELYNAGSTTISLAGWSLADGASVDPLPATPVAPHEFIVLAASDSFRTAFLSFSGNLVVLGGRIGNGLGNRGDRLLLRDPAGATVDAISWGSDTSIFNPAIAAVPTGHSIERRAPTSDTDSAADWVDNMHPSPGAPFTPAMAPVRAQPRTEATQTLPSAERSISWLSWTVVAASALALLAALSWRAAPLVSARLRRQA